jgi:hypothetical protein
MDVVGVWCRRYTRFGGMIIPPVRLPEDVMPKYDCLRCSILIGPVPSTWWVRLTSVSGTVCSNAIRASSKP